MRGPGPYGLVRDCLIHRPVQPPRLPCAVAHRKPARSGSMAYHEAAVLTEIKTCTRIGANRAATEDRAMTSFRVPDMTCAGCVRAITNAVKRADPAAGVTTDLAAHLVNIDSSAAAETLAATLRDAGFSPEPA